MDNNLKTKMVRQKNTWHAYGGFQNADYEISLATQNTWYQITNVAHDLWVGLEAEGLALSSDVMTFTYTGDYSGSLSLTLSGDNGKDFQIRIYNKTTLAQMGYIIGATTTGDANFTNITLPLYLEVSAGDELQIEIRCTSNDTVSPQLRSAVFWLSYLHD